MGSGHHYKKVLAGAAGNLLGRLGGLSQDWLQDDDAYISNFAACHIKTQHANRCADCQVYNELNSQIERIQARLADADETNAERSATLKDLRDALLSVDTTLAHLRDTTLLLNCR